MIKMQNSECRVQNDYIEAEFVLPEVEETVTLTRAEIDALTVYADKVRRETVKAIFNDIRELIKIRHKREDTWANFSRDQEDRRLFCYARNICECLLVDLMKLERKHNDEAD